jgi:hypothetical protein
VAKDAGRFATELEKAQKLQEQLAQQHQKAVENCLKAIEAHMGDNFNKDLVRLGVIPRWTRPGKGARCVQTQRNPRDAQEK